MVFTNPQSERVYNYLLEKYERVTISKSELAHETLMSKSSVNLNIAKGLGPRYIKMGTSKNATVRFNIYDVAEYLGSSIETV